MGDFNFSRDQIKDWNNGPVIPKSNVRLVPKEDAEGIEKDKQKINRKNIAIFILIVAVACLGVLTYLAWNNQLKLATCAPVLNLTCSSVQCSAVTMPPINIPACPACPSSNNTLTCLTKICNGTTC